MQVFSYILSLKVFEKTYRWYLLVFLFAFVILRIPSLAEPLWYGDEGIYQVVGRVIANDQILYKDVWDNKPPLLYYLYGVFNGDLFFVKLTSLLFGLLSVVSFIILSSNLFKKTVSVLLSTSIFTFFLATPIIEGNIANAENFMLLPILISANLVLYFSKNGKLKYIITAGLFLSVAFITKIVAVFDFIAFTLFLIYLEKDLVNISRFSIEKFKKLIVFFFSFIPLLFFSSIYFIFNGAFKEFFEGVFSQNINYVNVGNDYFFPLGILLLKTIILFIFLFILFINRKKFTKTELFVYLWTFLSIYNAFFSQRPYTHYLLVMLSAFALVFGFVFEKRNKILINLSLIVFLVLVSLNHFIIYKKTTSYYTNYIQFMLNKKSVTDYLAFFDAQTPRDYEIANFIKTNTKSDEKVFLWSNNAQIYILSDKLPIGKYVVAYHIKFYEDALESTIKDIEIYKPKYIIQNAPEEIPVELLYGYRLRYELEGANIYEREV